MSQNVGKILHYDSHRLNPHWVVGDVINSKA